MLQLDILCSSARILDEKVKGEINKLLCAIKSEEMLDRLTKLFQMTVWDSLAGLGTEGARTEIAAVVNVHLLTMQ